MKKKILKYSCISIPYILAYIGYRLCGLNISWALYYSFKVYGLGAGMEHTNLWLEFAKWTGAIVTFTVVLTLAKTIYERLKMSWRARGSKSCSVYGDNKNAEILLSNLGKDGIKGNLKKPYHSKYHIVMPDDNEEAVAFFRDFPEDLIKKSKTVVCFKGISPMLLQEENIAGFSIEENCAGLYWKKYRPEKGDKIAIIGSGDLFDEIMKKALLMNIFSPDQGIEYHLWNPSERFMTAHPELDNIAASTKDKIVYHGGDFIKDHEMMRSMNRLIFCGAEKDNITDALKLIAIMPLKTVYIYGKNKKGIERLFRSCETTIINFGAAEDTLTFDNVVREKQTETAKQISEHYRIKYGGDTWEYLDVFKRESSLSAAEYFPVIQMLNKKGLSIEELSELEHIRWCRFFWINNWHYNKVRDNSKRLHNCLVPYSDLTDAEKVMDTENVELALSKEFTSDS